MSSDADYASFLDKASRQSDPKATTSSSVGKDKKSLASKSVDTEVPGGLAKVEAWYTSDADEKFEPVALRFGGGAGKGKGEVGVEDLKTLLGADKDIEAVPLSTFESDYAEVVQAVQKAGNGAVRVFRVVLDGTRAEYYVVAVDEKEDRVVGLKALSVES